MQYAKPYRDLPDTVDYRKNAEGDLNYQHTYQQVNTKAEQTAPRLFQSQENKV